MEDISYWHHTHQEKLNLANLTPTDAVRLNPITIILERYAEVLYNHPFVRQYIFLKFRQDYILAGIIANVLLNGIFVCCLNIFAFSLQPLSFNETNSTNFEPFCTDSVCSSSRCLLLILLTIRMIMEFTYLIYSRT